MGTDTPEYFDLHVTGIGYASRFRKVKPRNGQPFWSVTLSALTGRKDAGDHRQYTKFDCRIVGEEALRRLQAVESDIPDKAVLVGFKIGDIYPESFEYQKKGESHHGVVIKGRLLKVAFVKVDGKDVPFDDPEATEAATQEGPTESSEEPAFRPLKWIEQAAVRTGTHWVLKLDKGDAHFDQKRAYLKELGFFFDRKTLSWRREADAAQAHVR